MDFDLKTLGLAGAAGEKTDALVVLVMQGGAGGKDAVSQLQSQAVKAGDLEAKPGSLLQAWRHPGVAAARVLLAGCGDGTGAQVRTAVQAAVAALRGSRVKRLAIVLPAQAGDDAVRAAVVTAADASYSYVTTKSKAEGRKLEHVTIGVANADASRQAFEQATATVKGIELAKEWANRPPNHATPTLLGEAARALAKEHGFGCEVLGPKEVAKLGMGSFMAVAQGSEEPLRFIVLKYNGAGKGDAPVVLVGKGITFDTGGISIKPSAEMDEMKFDMGGAASVLGAFRAVADLQPAINLVGLIPSCENMPDGRSVKPGDVVTSMSGQTIEILNTDAEGRLILCDALSYAERFKPKAVVDIATLTGACVVALGGVRSGMFASDDDLAQALQSAGDAALDPCWRMPLDDEYAEGLKTNFADVANVAGRAGGAVVAAKFLQRFTKAYPWGHLDVAGTAWKGGAAKGSTGRPVGLLVEFIMGQQGEPQPKPARKARRSGKQTGR
ncbi:leucyl aminopeptidase [Caenimonas terrae]|uniref:Probable cytosol aminopeptidase n=1 Tax=Caenimonas terrae TaxID=696074 RepID=A0ABW0NKR3_9BURK